MSIERPLTIAAALALDALFGELPNSVHPVALTGAFIGAMARRAPRRPRYQAFAAGIGTEAIVVGLAVAAGMIVERATETLPFLSRVAIRAFIFKQTFAVRALIGAAMTVHDRLASGDLTAAQAGLRNLVSRDRALPPSLVIAAAVESVVENLCDSVIAPVLAYAVGGLPAAMAYRAANTADAMLGYRGELEYYGKAAARLDDLCNIIPARVSALAMLAASPIARGSWLQGWRIMRRDHALTASPNAGWTMAAAAGLLGVALEKKGAYRLHAEADDPRIDDIHRACRLVVAASLGVATLAMGIGAVRRVNEREGRRGRGSTPRHPSAERNAGAAPPQAAGGPQRSPWCWF